GDGLIGLGAPVLRRYERVCFEREQVRVPGKPKAELTAPGRPLLDAVVDLIIERYGTLLKQGAILVDGTDPGEEPRLLVALTHQITAGHIPARTISKRFEFVEIRRDGTAGSAGPAPYLDYRPPTPDEAAVLGSLLAEPWLSSGVENVAVSWAVEHGIVDQLAEVETRVRESVRRTRAQVR